MKHGLFLKTLGLLTGCRFLSVHRGDRYFRVYLNGAEQTYVISCKTGKRGRIKRFADLEHGSVEIERIRGRVAAVRFAPAFDSTAGLKTAQQIRNGKTGTV